MLAGAEPEVHCRLYLYLLMQEGQLKMVCIEPASNERCPADDE
jgi:hypothetical protein